MTSFTVTNYQNKKYDGTHCWRVSFLQINTIWHFKNRCQDYVSISSILLIRTVEAKYRIRKYQSQSISQLI